MRTLIWLAFIVLFPCSAIAAIHTPFDKLLKQAVKGDRVDYQVFKSAPAFETYLKTLASTDPATLPSRDAKLAFWINAYNASTIAAVLEHWPSIKSVKDPYPDFGFFKRSAHTVAGKTVSLNHIENKIIRPTFKDPRVHAALNCASRACPPLMPFAFTAAGLNAQLNGAMATFARDNSRNRIDTKTGAVQISQIFNWYKADFEAAGGAQRFLTGFLKGTPRGQTLSAAKGVDYLPYDWALNRL